jgi:hypothetical protein
MFRWYRWMGVGMLAMLATAVSAQGAARKEITARRAAEGLTSLRAFATGKAVECVGTKTECNIDVEIIEVEDAQKVRYCVARIPESVTYRGAGPGADAGKFVWTLKPNVIGSATFEFQDKFGVLIIDESKGNGQFHDGQIGDGSGIAKNYQYHLKNKRKVKKSEVSYYPIVIKKDGDVPSLCAAIDPRIINN